MIEIHCHLLPNIDDGVKSVEQSVETIKKLVDIGYKKIIITPHYINGTSYNVDNKDKYTLFLELQKRIKELNLDIELYLGNEIFIDQYILDDLKSGKCCTMNSSRYVLVEISRNDIINDLDNILFKLLNKGIIPIMAHPERYLTVKKDKNILNDWINSGFFDSKWLNKSWKRYNISKYNSIVEHLLFIRLSTKGFLFPGNK